MIGYGVKVQRLAQFHVEPGGMLDGRSLGITVSVIRSGKSAKGKGVKGDLDVAMKWYRRAADAGHTEAMFEYAERYYFGQEVKNDYTKAMKWFRKAAEQGDAVAQNNLGWMYDEGKGVVQDYQEAARWYHLAAEQGHAVAQNNLGVMHVKLGVEI